MKARDDSRIERNVDQSGCRNGEQACPYLKEKWIKTTEEGTEFWMYSHSYCSLNECAWSDFDKPYQFDNLTGSMNL